MQQKYVLPTTLPVVSIYVESGAKHHYHNHINKSENNVFESYDAMSHDCIRQRRYTMNTIEAPNLTYKYVLHTNKSTAKL